MGCAGSNKKARSATQETAIQPQNLAYVDQPPMPVLAEYRRESVLFSPQYSDSNLPRTSGTQTLKKNHYAGISSKQAPADKHFLFEENSDVRDNSS